MKKLMNNNEYHSHEAIGSSILKKIAQKSLLHAIKEERKESDALDLGSAIHCAILEPEKYYSEFLIMPKVDGRTKEGKAVKADFEKIAQEKNMTIITDEQDAQVKAMVASIRTHEIANGMLTGGEAEYAYFAKDPSTGLMLKTKPDYKNAGALIDLKSCQDASREGFIKACINYNYALQAAFYLDVYNLATGENLTEFFFVAIETAAPFAVACYKMGEVEINVGREQYKKALKQLAEYKKDESKILDYGYEKKIIEIQFPIWALEKLSA